ncbi:metallophosphoesterase [Pontitalea aquivivens]|uniref:metallophosphoesterase n=1 Tax=Pontitalea aquivivens TaxID=3388663 RepID=UPI0039706D71
MKLWIWSDVHSEQQQVAFPPREQAPDCDAIVIAGDLNSAPNLPFIAEFLIDRYDKPIIYVPGNHEFYHDRWPVGDEHRSLESDRLAIKAVETTSLDWPQRFHCLDEDELVIGNTRFIGATLWVDLQMNLPTQSDLPQRMHEARGILNDFRVIYMKGGERFTPEHMLDLHRSNAIYLRQKLAEKFDGRTIVLTHHMPHPECTPPIYANALGNYLFACGAEAFDDILHSELAPDLWICGHTHYAFDIQVGRSRIICNPHGYGWEQGRNDFRWNWVIDTDDIGEQDQ